MSIPPRFSTTTGHTGQAVRRGKCEGLLQTTLIVLVLWAVCLVAPILRKASDRRIAAQDMTHQAPR